MTIYIEFSSDTFTRWTGGQIDGILMPKPKDIEAGWSDQEMADVGLIRSSAIVEADAIPDGKISTAAVAKRVEGSVKWVNTLINAPVLTLAERRTAAISQLKEKRWQIEIGGVDVTLSTEEVVPVSTGRGDVRTDLHIQMTTIGAGMRTDGATFNFSDGVPRSVSNADMLTVISSALTHVQAAFDREAVVTTALDDAETHVAIDAAIALIETGWPD